MADRLTSGQRSANMAAVKSKNTAPEIIARRAAHRLGLRFRVHGGGLPGRPDMVLPKHRTVVFVNGCFWHGHEGCSRSRLPRSNVAFWTEKISRNRLRDSRSRTSLEEMGWRVVILWECEIRTLEAASARISAEMRLTRRSAGKSKSIAAKVGRMPKRSTEKPPAVSELTTELSRRRLSR
jgi:DNA mismatch endonuclease (patch repair protein)